MGMSLLSLPLAARFDPGKGAEDMARILCCGNRWRGRDVKDDVRDCEFNGVRD
jgi:hypothetical protein